MYGYQGDWNAQHKATEEQHQATQEQMKAFTELQKAKATFLYVAGVCMGVLTLGLYWKL